MLARQLGWAIDHGFSDRVELLIANGVDLAAPLLDGRTPAEHALAAGYRDIIEDLRVAGVVLPEISPALAMVGALLAGDRRYVAEHSETVAAVQLSHPGLILHARTGAAVALISSAGFDIDARAGGSTALHNAAFAGDVDLITALLAAGVDRTVRDTQHGSTPLGWAEYGCHPAAAELLTTD
jgi:ankyrin repeat protein